MVKEDSQDEYFDYEENLNSSENSYDFEPQRMDKDVFKQRNDPEELLKRYRLQLMNAFKVKEEIIDKHGKKSVVYKVKRKKNTKPKANSQGIEDIINYVEKFVNNHTVQGNTESLEYFRNFMRFASNDLTMHFHTMRQEWGISILEIDSIIASAINLIELFLTRTLFNEERKGYGESFKETTSREIKPRENLNLMQKVGSFLGWKQ